MTAAPGRSADRLQDHFQRCLAQVLVGGQHSGTAFFVAPGKLLSCAHVVRPDRPTSIVWEGQTLPARIRQRLPDLEKAPDPYPHPDLALLEVDHQDHPCLRLDECQRARKTDHT